jgi:hypothetical protein
MKRLGTTPPFRDQHGEPVPGSIAKSSPLLCRFLSSSFSDAAIAGLPPPTSVVYFDALTAPSKKLAWFEESGHEPSSMKRPSSTQRRWRWCGHWRPETHNPAPSRLRERKTMRSPMSGASTSFCPSGPVCYGALVTALPV